MRGVGKKSRKEKERVEGGKRKWERRGRIEKRKGEKEGI